MKKLIAILGCSYCGSTYLSFVLGSLRKNKILSFGETHWILDKKENEQIDCLLCKHEGKRCPYLNKENLEIIEKSDERFFYRTLMDTFDIDFLVSSDKHPSNYVNKLEMVDEIQPLILFKQPERQLKSEKIHQQNLHKTVNSNIYLNVLDNIYKNIQTFASNYNKPVYVDFDFFMTNKKAVLRYMCDRLGLQFTKNSLKYWEYDHHIIRGNIGAYYSIIENNENILIPDLLDRREWYLANVQKSIQIDYRYKFALTPEELLMARNHEYNKKYIEMLDLFTDDFKKWARSENIK